MTNKSKVITLCFAFLAFCNVLNAQTTPTDSTKLKDAACCSKIKLNVSADIMSRYIWRGTDFGNSPAIQPTISLAISNFEIGCWSSLSTNSFYKEVDLYAKYTIGKVALQFTDYYVPSLNGTPASPDTRYFVYSDKKTSHSFEGSLGFKGGDKFPLSVSGNIYLYGNDKRWGYEAKKDTAELSYYSSYFEVGYTFPFSASSMDAFVGITPTAGAYGDSFGIVNAGITVNRKIKMSNDFELPIKASLIFNPQSSMVFVAFGMTL